MLISLSLQKFRAAGFLFVIGFVLTSCGSYQQASYYDNDGIYADKNDRPIVEKNTKPGEQKLEEDNVYSDYFALQSGQYENALDGDIFTDIDSYTSQVENDSISDVNLTDYYNNGNDYLGYAGWGDNTTSVSINIYDNSWGYGWSSPWLWNNYGWGGYYGRYGYSGYYSPWGWGGYYNPWSYGGYGYGSYYGYGYASYGWGGYGAWCPAYGYSHRYNRNRSYAYNSGRRGYYNANTVASNSRALRGRSNTTTSRANSPRYRSTTGRSSTGRSVATRSSRSTRSGYTSRRAVGVDQNRSYRTSRSTRAVPRYNSSSRSSQTYRSTTPRSSTYRSGTSRAGVRSTTPRSSTYRSSGSRTRSSSSRTNQSYRSSTPRSSSYRSSGSSRSTTPRSSSYRSSGSSRSSSATTRSSGSSSRSSGSSTRSSSGRSSGRRQ